MISMLTGMTTPTAGDASVYGKSVVEDMVGVREDIGFCPQVRERASLVLLLLRVLTCLGRSMMYCTRS